MTPSHNESLKTLRQGDWEVGSKGWPPYLKDDPLPQVDSRVQTEFRIIGPIALNVLGIRVGSGLYSNDEGREEGGWSGGTDCRCRLTIGLLTKLQLTATVSKMYLIA